MLIVYCTLAWVGGIVFAEYTTGQYAWLHWLLMVGALAGLWTRAYLTAYQRASLLIMWFCLGGLWLGFMRPAHYDLSQFNGPQSVVLEGVVVDEPLEEDRTTQVKLAVEFIDSLNRWQSTSGTALVTLFSDEEIQYGDRIRVRGSLLPAPEIDTFAYNTYLARRGIFSVMTTDTVRVIEHDQASPIRSRLLKIKGQAASFIEEALPEPQSGLLIGILLGDESRLSRQVEADFAVTGASHIIAISGFNLTLIAGVVSALVVILIRQRYAAIAISLGIVGLYVVFVGGGPGVMRAFVMSAALIFARVVFRRTYVPASLSAAVMLLSFLDPYMLWDIGFQLSVAAVFGMALLTPTLDRLLQGFLERLTGLATGRSLARLLSEPISVTFAAQIATLPIILYYFGSVSPISPLVNFLIIPAQPLLLIMGALATLLSFIHPILGVPLFTIDWLFLTYTTTVVRGLADIAPVWEVHPGPLLMWMLLIIVTGMAIARATRPNQWRDMWGMVVSRQAFLQIVPLLLGLFLFGSLVQQIVDRPDDRLHVIFLDMGHSNSVLIRTPEGAVYIIDGGDYPSRLLTTLGDYLPPNKRTIDILFVTDDRHIDALPDVLERYDVQLMIYNEQSGTVDATYLQLLDVVENKIAADAGWRIESRDGVSVEVLSPQEDVDTMVLRLTYHDTVFLFTSDLEIREERLLLGQPHLIQANVLQIGGHAADDTNSPRWIGAVHPQVAILQTDPATRFEPTLQGIVDRFEGARLYRTDLHGAIEIVTDGQSLEIYTSE